MALLPALQSTVDQLIGEFNQILDERKVALENLTKFIKAKFNEWRKDLSEFYLHP